jgi:phosphoadenosine phosphosulfate reductase
MITEELKRKIEESYEVLKLAAKICVTYYGEPLIITYSGGKDSDVMLQLAKECLKPDEFEVINSHTTVDAPPTVYHIRRVFAKLKGQGIKATIKMPVYKGEPTNMWKLIVQKKMPPTRRVRYCCQILKESATPHRVIALGVRAQESKGRQGRGDFGIDVTNKNKACFWNTEHVNEVIHEALEAAKVTGKEVSEPDVTDCTFVTAAKGKKNVTVNPIYDWSTQDVWDFIKDRNLSVCPLYSMGYERVGCVGCPLATKKQRRKEFFDFPKYEELYKSAFQRMLRQRKDVDGKNVSWKTGEEVFSWWMQDDTIPGQMTIQDYLSK